MSAIMDAAQLWLSRGISPIPVSPRSKLPVFRWKKWTTQLPTQKHLDVWFKNPNSNLAIICGMSNLVVIDFDDLEKCREYLDNLSDVWWNIFTGTYSVTTSRGIHIYLYCDKLPQKHTIKEQMIDIKSSGIVLVPPSIHPCGTAYVANNAPILHVADLDELFPPYKAYTNIVQHEVNHIQVDSEYSWDVRVDETCCTLDDILKIPILTMAGWYTRMRPENARFWLGLCPGHDDHHPSFKVDTERNTCFCHSTRCKLNGDYWHDTLDFYSLIEGIDKKEAFKQLRRIMIK